MSESATSDEASGPAVSAARGGDGRDSSRREAEVLTAPREMPVTDEGPSVDEIIKVSLSTCQLATMRACLNYEYSAHRQMGGAMFPSLNVTKVLY